MLDAGVILQIPLGHVDEDVIAWSQEKSGIYSVRSAYIMLSFQAMSKESEVQGSVGDAHGPPNVEKSLVFTHTTLCPLFLVASTS